MPSLFSFPQDNGDCEGRCQRFREVPAKLAAALEALAARNPASVIHLGDIVNGGASPEATSTEFALMASIFDDKLRPASIPAIHVLGNHCLDAGRPEVQKGLGIPDPGYYVKELPHGWTIIVLDTTEISGHSGFPEGSWQYKEARAYEAAHLISEKEPQMSPWNGGVSEQQMKWLKEQLKAAEAAGRRVIVAAHHPLGTGAGRATHMAWNCRAIEAACLESPAFRVALHGHDHEGGYAALAPLGAAAGGGDRHFVTLEGLVEAPEGSNAYAMLRFFEDKIELEGVGAVTSRTMVV